MRKSVTSLASPKVRKLTSQLSINDFPNMNSLVFSEEYRDQELDGLTVMACQATIVGREIIRTVVHRASQIIHNNFIESMVPQYTILWAACKFEQQVALQHQPEDDHMADRPQGGLTEDEEPTPVNIEHWRRFQGSVNPQRQLIEPLSVRDSKTTTKSLIFEQRKPSTRLETHPIKMGEVEEDLLYDPEIESIRQAKLRQIQIQQQKEQYDKVKLIEAQEQVKQLKRLNVDSKSQYTFDFEGRVVVQKPPDMERYPKPQERMIEKRQLIEVRDLFPNHRQLSEQISNQKKQSYYQQGNQFTARQQISLMEQIKLQQGVSYFEGKSEKKNDRPMPLMDIKDQSVLSQTLQSSEMQMTRIEYQTITNQNFSGFSKTNYKKNAAGLTQPQQKYFSSMQNTEQELQNESSLMSKLIQNQFNSSMSLLRLNGSISICSEQNIEDLLIDHGQQLILQQTVKGGVPQQQQLPQQQQQQQQQGQLLPAIELPPVPKDPLSNSKCRLPRTYQSMGTLPKLLPKGPRDRIPKKAIMLRITE